MTSNRTHQLIAALLLLSAGCGGSASGLKTGTVSGSVTLKGTAFGEGRVALYSPGTGTGVLATLDTDGRFQIPEPLPVGEYSVAISPPEMPEPQPGKPPVYPKKPEQGGIPTRYRSAENSGLQLTIAPGKNTLDVNMEK